ncbi:15568_t:CDS:2 [Funneliformis caledonium]|uniref:15568_t:CDS:1 n=1 Tax=Funneliformis caledonium TaxID=1117310 RepID=A0A9N8ZZF4_9GLOM|nr:15568_t:CDS:2 [Funneliformis caledonium]
MYYNDLIIRRRKTEPKSVHVLRACIKILLIAFLLAYTTVLIKEVIDSDPVIQISEEDNTEMPFPDMLFYADYPFNLECRFRSEIGATADYSCNNSLIQPQLVSNVYLGYFFNNNHLKFTADVRYATSHIEIYSFSNTSVDYKEYNPIKSKEGTFDLNVPIVGHVRDLILHNSYAMMINMYSLLKLSRRKKQKMRKEIRSILGLPSYDEQPFIVSDLQSMPLLDEDRDRPEVYFSKFVLTVATFQIQVETERRIRTLLGVFGIVGGASSIAMALYTFLFGANLFRPWGYTQAYCCGLSYRTYNKLKNSFPVLPLVNSSSLMTKPNPSLQDIKELQDRLNSLEMFLKEYVIDVNYLEKSEKMDLKVEDDDKEYNLNNHNQTSLD